MPLQKINITNQHLRFILAAIATLLLSTFLFGQQNSKNSYQTEFKQVAKNSYLKKLISLSNTQIDLKWNNYQGKAIYTEDSSFQFGGRQLNEVFPTNSAIHSNDYLIYYFSQKTAKCPTLFSLLNYYESIINEHLNNNNLPKELKLLPSILSAFNPNSNNGIGGIGYWHLNYPQAIKYGLTINDLIDERRGFEKSTKAATRYLKDLHSRYNDWELTLTAYASGITTVSKLLQRHSATTYKEIYPYLPKETKDLVQAFVAINYVYNYDTYGTVPLSPSIEIDTVLIDRKLKFEAINTILKTKSEDFKFLNPILNKEIFPTNFIALFPKGKGIEFAELKDSIYFFQDSVMSKPEENEDNFIIPKSGEQYIYTVRSGDVLGLIADRNNVRVSQLQDWNGLNGTRINIGQKLTIYGKGTPVIKKKTIKPKQKGTKSTLTVSTPKQQKTTKQIAGNFSNYTVKSGENLWVIAKKYSGVSAQNIMDFNKIDGNLNIGQVLKIPKY